MYVNAAQFCHHLLKSVDILRSLILMRKDTQREQQFSMEIVKSFLVLV